MRARPEAAPHQRLRCAIYTRKSTEEGLDQAFNSLDAQREACAAYIVSQRHEGWIELPGAFDDGGFSGGNMQRPGLSRLLADVQAGRVDVIVVYKVDRLTRALSDFARIVDVLDKHDASFVSVTQAFNTTTSMGRLTLNVLLSFAQFEREVISERVRDKVAASKKKGMWMGGVVSLGYEARDRQLVVNEDEAKTVRHIMGRYLALGAVRPLIAELAADGIVTKRQRLRDGRLRGGSAFTRGALYHLLHNRLYRGEVVHRGQVYPGQHDAIVDAGLFDAVQHQLAENAVERRQGRGGRQSLLAGMIRDAAGRPLSPSHASKQGQRYLYYVSNTDAGSVAPTIRLAAPALERAVGDAVREALRAPDILPTDLSARQLAPLQRALATLLDRIPSPVPQRHTLATLDLQLDVGDEAISGSICRDRLLVLLDPAIDTLDQGRRALQINTTLRRRGHELRLRIDPPRGQDGRDEKLVATIIRAHEARGLLDTAESLASSTLREMRRLARLSYLAPDIVAAIFEGRQPRALTTRTLTRIADLPLCWRDQHTLLGFA